MRFAMRGALAALALTQALTWSAALATAQDYPSRPIKIVIAFPAG